MRRALMAVAVVAMCVACVLASGLIVAGPVSGDSPPGDEIAIQVSPGTIALNAQTVWLTIHADIPFATVDEVAVTVNGTAVTVTRTFADSLGDLVVKCPIAEVKAIVQEDKSATVRLDAVGIGSGSDTVRVTPGGRK